MMSKYQELVHDSSNLPNVWSNIKTYPYYLLYLYHVNVIHQAIEANFPSDQKVVIGVSGGMDSCVLLHALYTQNIPCIVAHVNYAMPVSYTHLRAHET